MSDFIFINGDLIRKTIRRPTKRLKRNNNVQELPVKQNA